MLNNEVRQYIRNYSAPLSIPAYNAMACVHVESAGVTFWTVKGQLVPAARPEGHYFYARLSGAKRDAAIRAGLAHPSVGGVRVPAQREAVYDMIERMKAIDESAALESCSWGLGQVMGANWRSLNYGSVQELVAANMRGIDGQIECMFRFIKANNLVSALQRGDFVTFARVYNGPGYAMNRYDVQMATWAATYKNLEQGAVTETAVRSAEVEKIQTTLKRLGFYTHEVDGIEGSKTTAAVTAFQTANGLVADGLWGQMTAKIAAEKVADLDRAAGDRNAVTGVGGTMVTQVAGELMNQINSVKMLMIANPLISTAITILTLAAIGLAIYGLWQRFRAKP